MRVLLALLMMASVASATPRGVWDIRQKLRDGLNGYLLKDADHGGIVFLNRPDLPDVDSVAIFRKRPINGKCKWGTPTSNKRITVLTPSGRANGNREHWRDRTKQISDLPTRCTYVRMVYSIVTAEGEVIKYKHALSMNKVLPGRND